MKAKERRDELLNVLRSSSEPKNATDIAEHFGVSRQIIVGDVALLRASGHNIVATQSGYILQPVDGMDDANTYIIPCWHDKVALETELYTIVDNGGTLVDVSVDHPIYGIITQPLNIASRYDADDFLRKVAVSGGELLSALTEGAHLHTIRCVDPEAYRRILAGLKEWGILYTK